MNEAINQLPAAQTLTGLELVPVMQNGTTVQTTVSAITSSPVLTQTFLTVGAQPGLANSRYIGVGAGLSIVDGGAASQFSINLTGAPLSLVTSPTGFQVKTASNTLTSRLITVGSGLGITNPDGIAGNPLIAYTGLMSNLAALSGTGLVAVNGTTASPVVISPTANQTTVANGNGVGSPTIGLASNLIAPGTGAITIPVGNLAQRPVGALGQIRYDTDLASFEGYTSSGWGAIIAGVAVTLINTGTGLTGGPIISAGTISLANTTVTPGAYGSTTQVGQFTVNNQGQLSFAGNVTISASGIGAVTSVAASVPSVLSISGSPITSSGTLAIGYSGTALPTANGGTNSTTTPTAGGAVYGTASSYAFTAAGTAGQVLTSAGASAPIWSGISGGTF